MDVALEESEQHFPQIIFLQIKTYKFNLYTCGEITFGYFPNYFTMIESLTVRVGRKQLETVERERYNFFWRS